MNREEELKSLINKDMSIPDSLDDIVKTQVQTYYHQRIMKNYLYKPLLSLACIVVTIITVFNLFPSTAYACKDIPILGGFVKVFCFDKAVLECIDNDYGLYLNIRSQDVTLEYMTVDDAQVSFYLSGYKKMDPENIQFISHGLYSTTVIYPGDSYFIRIQMNYDDIEKVEFDDQLTFDFNNETYTFDIPLEKIKIQPPQVIEINQNISVGHQKITLDKFEIYPTVTKLYVTEDKQNSLRLDELNIDIVQDNRHYTNNRNGISRMDGKDQKVYMIESSYFHKQDLTMFIKQISFIDEYSCQMNVQEKTIENLPKRISCHDLKIENNQITLTLRAPFVNSTYAIVEEYYEDHQKIRIDNSHMSQYFDKDYFEQFIIIPYHKGKNYELLLDDHIYYDLSKEIKIK